ncbi:MAG: serine hydrolase [Bacillota bacterium]|nr:serine hydrolase [Bacillota bacterium]
MNKKVIIQDLTLMLLQMNNSYLSKAGGKAGGMAAGHVKWLGFPFATDVQYLENSLAAGFIISSVEDMSRYLLMHMNNGQFANQSIVSEGGTTELQRPGTVKEGNSDYVMGLVNLSLDDLDLIGHDGSTPGFNAGMAFAPENQWGVVVLTNTSAQVELTAFPLVLGVMELISYR